MALVCVLVIVGRHFYRVQRGHDNQPLLDDANTSGEHCPRPQIQTDNPSSPRPQDNTDSSHTDITPQPQPLYVPTDDEFVNPIVHASLLSDSGPHWTAPVGEQEEAETKPKADTGAIPKRKSYMGEPVRGAGTTPHGPTAADLPGLNENPDFTSYFKMDDEHMADIFNDSTSDSKRVAAAADGPPLFRKFKRFVEETVTRNKK